MNHLDETNSSLLHLPDIHILPQRNTDPCYHIHRCCRNKHVSLRLSVAKVDGISCRGANRVALLCLNDTVDARKVVHRLSRQVSHEPLGKDAGPHSSSNGRSDGRADRDDHALDCKQRREVLLFRDCHERSLLGDDEHTATESNEDHTHDDVSNVLVWLAELDHKPDTQDRERYAPEQTVHLQLAVVVSQAQTVDERDEAATHGVDVGNVGGVWYALVEHDHEQRVEVAVPNVPADVEGPGHGVGEDDSAVLEQMPRDESDGCAILFP